MKSSYSTRYAQVEKNKQNRFFSLKNRVKKKAVVNFTRDLSILLSARILLTDSMAVLIRQQKNQRFGQILNDILNHLNAGVSLSESFRRYPAQFNNFYINLVEVGELTGNLDQMLNRITVYLEKIGDLRRKLIQSLTYPALIIAVALVSMSFIFFYVIPTFSSIFQDFDAELPLLTMWVLNISKFLKANIWYILLVFVGCLALIHNSRHHPMVQTVYNKIMLNIPLLGSLLRKNHISQFCRTLGTLLESGISLMEALEIASRSTSNYYIRRDIQQMKFFAAKGEKLTHSLSHSRIFPLMVTQMISVGEESAELPFMLLKIADHYDKEIDGAIEILSSVIEPVVIILLGIIIGIVLVSIYLPLFNMANVMQG